MAEAVEPPAPPAEAIHLLRPDASHNYLVPNPEALKILDAVGDGPMTVLTLVGPQRGGKSTLLNLLHSRSLSEGGFGLGHHMDPQTTGLWMRFRPHPRHPDTTVLLLDTEGLDSPHVPPFYNWCLSAVALLISDYFVYQSKGSIDTTATDQLDIILRVADQLRGDSAEGDSRPSFLWLLRDHHLQMRSEPREEMLGKLDAAAVKTLKRCFMDADCFPLPTPLADAAALRVLETKTYESLASDFKEEFCILERRLFKRLARARTLNGTHVTGAVIAGLLSKYAEAASARKGAVAEIAALPTQRQLLLSMAGERAVRSGLSAYNVAVRDALKSSPLPLSLRKLLVIHDEAIASALGVFSDEFARSGGGGDAEAEDRVRFSSQLRAKIAIWNGGAVAAANAVPFSQNICDADGSVAGNTDDNVDALDDSFAEQEAEEESRREAMVPGRHSSALERRNVLGGGVLLKLYRTNHTRSLAACTKALDAITADGSPGWLPTLTATQDIVAFDAQSATLKATYNAHPDVRGPAKAEVWEAHALSVLAPARESVARTQAAAERALEVEAETAAIKAELRAEMNAAAEAAATDRATNAEAIVALTNRFTETVAALESRADSLETALASQQQEATRALSEAVAAADSKRDSAVRAVAETAAAELAQAIVDIRTEAADAARASQESLVARLAALEADLLAKAAESATKSGDARAEEIRREIASTAEEVTQRAGDAAREADAAIVAAGEEARTELATTVAGLVDSAKSEAVACVEALRGEVREERGREITALKTDIEATTTEAVSVATVAASSKIDAAAETSASALDHAVQSVRTRLAADIDTVKSEAHEAREELASRIQDTAAADLEAAVGAIEVRAERADAGRWEERRSQVIANVETTVRAEAERASNEAREVTETALTGLQALESKLRDEITFVSEQTSEKLEATGVSVKSACADIEQRVVSLDAKITAGDENVFAVLRTELGEASARMEEGLRSAVAEAGPSTEEVQSVANARCDALASHLEGQIAELQASSNSANDLHTRHTDGIQSLVTKNTELAAELEGIRVKFEGRVRKLETTTEEQEDKIEKYSLKFGRRLDGFRDNVSGLWENLGDTACRITDLQSALDSMQ